jgi:hypothetical protein
MHAEGTKGRAAACRGQATPPKHSSVVITIDREGGDFWSARSVEGGAMLTQRDDVQEKEVHEFANRS